MLRHAALLQRKTLEILFLAGSEGPNAIEPYAFAAQAPPE